MSAQKSDRPDRHRGAGVRRLETVRRAIGERPSSVTELTDRLVVMAVLAHQRQLALFETLAHHEHPDENPGRENGAGMTTTERPEIDQSAEADGLRTNYLEAGKGEQTVLLIHGSGPGVTSYANWRLVIPSLAEDFHVIAPDMVGFGFSDRPDGVQYGLDTWARQTVGLMDTLGIDQAHLVGNSFGGAIALRIATRHPDRVGKLVLMGSMGVPFEITEGLDRVWGYEASLENMRRVLDVFAYSRELVNDELAQVRYEASIQPGFQEAFSAMFPAPRQRWVEAMTTPDDELRALPHRTLVVHGREDMVIPVSNSYRLEELIENADLSVFSKCGHWSMIERNADFNRLVRDFFLGS